MYVINHKMISICYSGGTKSMDF